jgi:serine/threonine-protein kinase
MAEVPTGLATALADRYTLQRELGRGGMATVYLAEDRKHERRVALKVVRPELAAVLGPERFLREVKIAAQLTHPHILPLYDSGRGAEGQREGDVGFLYYVMPYVEGESLRDRLNREKQLPLDDALQISREVADALSYAHSHGVIHRDIKPENILLESGHAVVADFGIARAIDQAGGERLTETGVALGTPTYMSPEQAGGSRDLDGRSDLYSLGCVLYEMLAGQPPFTGPTVESVVHQHLAAEPPNITNIRPSVPGWVVAALQRSLAKTPADRFNPVAQFGEALAPRVSVTEVPVTRRPSPRHWPWIAVAAVAVVVAGLVVGREFLFRSGGSSVPPGPRPYTIVAEFDGSAPADIRDAVRRLVMTELDRSAILEVLPQSQVRLGLASASLPDTTPLAAAVARELAVRGRIATVITGTVERLGSSYALSVRALMAERDSTLATARAEAAGDDALIGGTSRAVRDLRRDLGERGADLGTQRGGTFVVTPSFEAFHRFLRGSQAFARGGRSEAIAAYREAVAIDSGFANAWSAMGIAYYSLGQRDSAILALQAALRHTDRMPELGRNYTEAMFALMSGDVAGALQGFERAGNRHNQGLMLFALGRAADAAVVYEGVIQNSPFGPPNVTLLTYAEALVGAGRLTEAEQVAQQVAGTPSEARVLAMVLGARGDWERADSLGRALLDAPTSDRILRIVGTQLRASALSARGQIRTADALLERGVDLGPRIANARALLQLVGRSGSEAGTTPLRDQGPEALAHGALLAAASGQLTLGARYLDQLEAGESPADLKGLEGVRRVARALLLQPRGRWADVVEELRPLREHVNLEQEIELFVRWITARSFQALGQLDSAAYFYERVVAPSPLWGQELERAGIPQSFARQHLVVLYSQMGRLDDARRHWKIFSETFTQPDPEVAHLVEEARAALEAAERKAN